MSLLPTISNVIYDLKRRFGVTLVHVRPTRAINHDTGVITSSYVRTTLEAVVGTSKDLLTAVTAMFPGNAKLGAYFEQDVRFILVDAADLPDAPTKADFFQYQSLRYNVTEVHEAEQERSYLIVAKALKGQPVV
jgi:hypothetical protein